MDDQPILVLFEPIWMELMHFDSSLGNILGVEFALFGTLHELIAKKTKANPFFPLGYTLVRIREQKKKEME